MRISDWSSDVCSSDLQAGVARPDEQLVDIVLVERIAHPGKDIESSLGPEPRPEIRQRIAIDPSIGRRRRIGREVRPIAAVIAQIDLASLIEQPRRRIRLGAEAERPFRDAWQALTRNITDRKSTRLNSSH